MYEPVPMSGVAAPAPSANEWRLYGVTLQLVEEVNSGDFDSLVLIISPDRCSPAVLQPSVDAARHLDAHIYEKVVVLPCPQVSGGRLVLSSTGRLSEYDDVRSLYEAARAGVRRALKAGAARPVLVLQPYPRWPYAEMVLLLGALEVLYVPLQVRELFPAQANAVKVIGIYSETTKELVSKVITKSVSLEKARGLARDIGGGDPERMTPLKAAQYICNAFEGASCVSASMLDDMRAIKREYPLLAAVARAADSVDRHRSCVVYLEYKPEQYKQTVMLVGKGVTYDTGGADIKTKGAMAGMSRDKCGAAAIVGFVKACELLQPPLKVVAALAMTRNSIGENSYVSDELIVSRSGLAVRVGNTDAEGRMILGDLLAEMAERAAYETCPHLYSIATLTWHAVRSYGDAYTAVMDNHVAHAARHATSLQESGAKIGDMMEVSTIRREDFAECQPRMFGDQLHQCRNQPSSETPRGHQVPAAFLVLVSGLDRKNVPYTHMDVTGSAGLLPKPPTAAPLLALAAHYDLLWLKCHCNMNES